MHSNSKNILLLLFLIFSNGFAQAQQYELKGLVKDSKTHEALPFVNIVLNDGIFGGTTDIDGKFHLKSSKPVYQLRMSYVGYQTYEQHFESHPKTLTIYLTAKSIDLQEVVVRPGINPAHRIIDSVLLYSEKNNPEKLSSFAYTSYDKMVLTIDTLNYVQKSPADTVVSDTNHKAREFLRQRDLFMMETVTERKFMAPNRNYENVLATKISGFQDPIFIFLMAQIQSRSFYQETIRIADKNYINPISKGSKRKYLFILEQQNIVNQSDTLYTISFRPLRNTNFDGLKGVMNIRSDGWAIQNITAKPDREETGFSIEIQQMYEKIEGRQWFPVQLNTNILLSSAVMAEADRNYPLIGIGKSYLRDIQLNPELVKRQFSHIDIEVATDATEKDAAFWLQHRIDSLNARTIETYRFMDSLGKANQFDRIAKSFESLMTGKIPIQKIDLDLNQLIRFNDYEGIYLGLGLQTNDKFSRKLKLAGFWGYGFGDQTAKYGLRLNTYFNRTQSTGFWLDYHYKAVERGGFALFGEIANPWSPNNYRLFYINKMDMSQAATAGFHFRALRHFNWKIALISEQKTAVDVYQFTQDAKLENEFRFTKIQLESRFAYKEKYMQTSRNLISLGSDYPIVWLRYTHFSDQLLDGQFKGAKLEMKTEYSFFTPYFGTTSISLLGGIADESLPATELFNAPATYRGFALYAPESFGTMRTNEFLSDHFGAIFLTHNFGKLLVRNNKFEPEFALALNVGLGSLENPEPHNGITFNTMEHGFYEGGLLIYNLFKLPTLKIGLGTFYRFGPYGYHEVSKNFGFKFSLEVGL
ncbi:MAG: hypothetical protein PWQ54_2361 [Bacteroidales bacterium]|jgi:hypothetical protein|nr:hypothetical protein [Bacteroidales bacterium]